MKSKIPAFKEILMIHHEPFIYKRGKEFGWTTGDFLMRKDSVLEDYFGRYVLDSVCVEDGLYYLHPLAKTIQIIGKEYDKHKEERRLRIIDRILDIDFYSGLLNPVASPLFLEDKGEKLAAFKKEDGFAFIQRPYFEYMEMNNLTTHLSLGIFEGGLNLCCFDENEDLMGVIGTCPVSTDFLKNISK